MIKKRMMLDEEQLHMVTLTQCSDLGGHAVARIEDGFVIVFRALVQAVAASLGISHLKDRHSDDFKEKDNFFFNHLVK